MSREYSNAPDALREQAVHWYVERMSGEMTLEDERRFLDWINQSSTHHKAFHSVDRAWRIAGSAKNDPVLLRTPTRLEDPVLEDELEQSEYPAPVRVAPSRWRLFGMVASFLLVVGIGSSALTHFLIGDRELPLQAFQTETGQRTTITLPDGSVVTLDSETAMRYRDTPKERHAELLRGRAFFKVASNPSRPFIVSANGKRVRAIGTAFEVSMIGREMTVVLAEGKVRVEEVRKPANGTDMTPGRQLVINSERRWTLSNVDVKKETGWTEGRLIFMHDPLSKAIAEVNLYSTRKLTFKDGTIPDTEIIGVFSAGDVESFITALELNGIAKRISTTADKIILAEEE